MNFFEKIKRFFFKNKTKFLTSTINVEKIALLIKKEKDSNEKINILRNYYQEFSSSELTQIIINLPINKRTEAIEMVQKYITPYDLYDISIKHLDYNGKLEILEKFQYKLDLQDIYNLFYSLPPDQRVNALKKCIDRFDSFELSEVIKKYIPLYEKLDCLNLYHEKLDNSAKANIISILDSERKIRALNQYGKELNKTDLKDIICETETNKVYEVFDTIYMYLTSQAIEDIIQYYIPENKKLDALYKASDKLNSATISDLIKFAIPKNQQEEALIALQDKIKSNNIGEVIQFCIKGKNILDKVKHNLDKEDLEYFVNK